MADQWEMLTINNNNVSFFGPKGFQVKEFDECCINLGFTKQGIREGDIISYFLADGWEPYFTGGLTDKYGWPTTYLRRKVIS